MPRFPPCRLPCWKFKKFWEELIAYFPLYDTDPIENDGSNNSSIVTCVFFSAIGFLRSQLSSNNRRDTHTDTQTVGRNL
jgi:hypothetical protein